MFAGKQLWDRSFTEHMQQREIDGLRYDVYPNLPKNLYAALQQTAAAYPDRIAVVDDDGTRLTYSALLRMVDRFAYFLSNRFSVGAGKHVALMLYSGAVFCVSYLALTKLAAVTLALPTKFRREEVLALLEKSDAALILCDVDYADWMAPLRRKGTQCLVTGHSAESLAPYLSQIPAQADARCGGEDTDPAILMYTSGTTSLSKGALLTNLNVMHSVETYRSLLGITPEDKTVIGVPIYHVTGLIALLSLFLYVGGTVYLHKRFNATRILRCVEQEGITFLHGAPTVFSLLLQEKASFPHLPSLRLILCGSSYMPKEKILAMHDWLPETEFRTVYGMTETSSPATLFPCDTATSPYITSCGLPVPCLSMRVVDEQGAELPLMQVGEVQMKGTVILREYYKQHVPELSDDGWLSTGDMGYFNEQGYLFLVDRKKDMINRGGEKICSYDVEHALYHLKGVADAAVVGIPDETYGEVAAAVVVPQPGVRLTQEGLQEQLAERLARYKIPARILFAGQLPTTANGKIDKKLLRSRFRD